jgi:hypothetical protein
MKRLAIDRLAEMDIDVLASLMEHSCGYEIDFYIRKKLPAMRRSDIAMIRKDIRQFAVHRLYMSSFRIVRFFQERRIRRQLGTGACGPDYETDYKYYTKVQDLLSTIRS